MGEGTEGIETAFEDIKELIAQCRFSDCEHRTEPGCAVKKALEDGSLDIRHWKTYLDLCKEEAYAEKRQQILMRKNQKLRKRR